MLFRITCHINSILQCLVHIPELNDFFINKYEKKKEYFKKINKEADTKGRLSNEFFKIVSKTYEDTKNSKSSYLDEEPISPKNFNDTLSKLNPQFQKFESNDAKDLLLYLFQAMHSELNYYGNKKLEKVPKCNQLIEKESFDFFMTVNNNLNLSIFSFLFYGILKSKAKCLECKNILYSFQYFQFLSFPTFNFKDKDFNIYQGFKEFVKPEKMIGDNQCYCQKCKGLRDAKVTSKIYETPPYLIINFDYGKDKKYKPKKVNFGQKINILDFIDKERPIIKEYELISVSTHIGISGNSGHYIAYCKNSNDKWYKFNDSSVKESNSDDVYSNSPYLLIYKRFDLL